MSALQAACHLNKATKTHHDLKTFSTCPRWQTEPLMTVASKPNSLDDAHGAFFPRGTGLHPGQAPLRGAGSCTVKINNAITHKASITQSKAKVVSQHHRYFQKKD